MPRRWPSAKGHAAPSLGLATVFAALAWLGLEGTASADDRDECASSYVHVQVLRKAGRLRDARRESMTCSRDVCAPFIASDCTRWNAELDEETPTMALALPSCQPQGDVKVTVDGVEQTSANDGLARAFDPGTHSVDASVGARAAHRSVLLVAGERNKVVSFAEDELCSAPAMNVKAEPARPALPVRTSKLAPAVWGLTGLVLAGAGAALWVVGNADAHTATCSTDPKIGCPSGERSQVAALLITGDVSMALGLVGVSVATFLLLRSPSPGPTTTVGIGWQSVWLRGSF